MGLQLVKLTKVLSIVGSGRGLNTILRDFQPSFLPVCDRGQAKASSLSLEFYNQVKPS